MNKQSFIERLNLHLDKELTPDESEELLAEIRENPEYHRIYVEYCKLFNACSQLGTKFAEPSSKGMWRQRVYAYGGMAAAVALLLLAARNLTPMLDGINSQLAFSEPSIEAMRGTSSEPLRVMNVNDIDGEVVLLGDSLKPVFFNLEGAFDQNGKPHNFGTDSDIRFASFTVVQNKQIESNWSQKKFTFGEPVETSTFEHEALSLSEAAEQGFSVQSVGSAFDQSVQSANYEFGSTAVLPVTTKP